MNQQLKMCDSKRIELFFDQMLSNEEESAFELHLDQCSDCRSRLEARAASDEMWSHVRQTLVAEPLSSELEHLPGNAAKSDMSDDAPFDYETLFKLLGPTDDDRSIGRLGNYEVLGVIGAGGMGVVLKAFDGALNRYVAIKVLMPHLAASGAARRRFSREAQAAAAVVHDNVIEIHGVSQSVGLSYLVMPYVPGASLQRRLDHQGPLALAEVLRIGMQAASGLAAAHAQGLVHRDVKPANILLTDGVERVKLTDFGLARAADDASLTKSGFIAGTPQYMSPEQARGESVDHRSDLFSLGCVLYAACTGRAPFRADTSYGVLRRITDEEPRPIREINPDVPTWLCEVIAKLMSKQADDRYSSAREVADLLKECLAHVQQPHAVALPAILGRRQDAGTAHQSSWVRRGLLALAGAAVLCVAAIVIVLESNKGTLTIECADSNVPVRIMKGERLYAKLTVTPHQNSVRIAAGEYVVEIAGNHDRLEVKDGVVQLSRGQTAIVKIVEKLKAAESRTENDGRSVANRKRGAAGGLQPPSAKSFDESLLPKVDKDFRGRRTGHLRTGGGIVERITDRAIIFHSGEAIPIKAGTIVEYRNPKTNEIVFVNPGQLEPGMALSYSYRNGEFERLTLEGIADLKPSRTSIRISGNEGKVAVENKDARLEANAVEIRKSPSPPRATEALDATTDQILFNVVVVKDDALERIEKSAGISAAEKPVLRKFVREAFYSKPPVIDGVRQGAVNVDADLLGAMLRKLIAADVAEAADVRRVGVSKNEWKKFELAQHKKELNDVGWYVELRSSRHGRLGICLCRGIDVAAENPDPATVNNLIRLMPQEAAIMPWYFHFLEAESRSDFIEQHGGDLFVVVQLAPERRESEATR